MALTKTPVEVEELGQDLHARWTVFVTGLSSYVTELERRAAHDADMRAAAREINHKLRVAIAALLDELDRVDRKLDEQAAAPPKA